VHGIELEILTYLDGPHWHMNKPAFITCEIFMSHIGFHMDEGEKPLDTGITLQRMRTLSHTNAYLLSKKRTYEYLICESPIGGVDTKFIWRKHNV
jgi:hypothetical protein